MSIRPYLVPKRNIVPDLEKIVPPSMAKAVWKEVESTTRVDAAEQSRSAAMGSMKRCQYDKTITETQKAKIARYAAESGIAAALRHFKTKQGLELKESTVRGWKKRYCAELPSQKRKGDDKPVEKLPAQAWGRPLEQDVERHAMKVIHQVRESGGVVNNSVVIGIIKGIMRDTDSNLLAENGGPITVGKEAAQHLLGRMQFVKRRGTTKAKVVPSDFQALEAQFLGDIRLIAIFDNIPAKLILNWDHTGLNYVPSS